jgi:hypothetical protein
MTKFWQIYYNAVFGAIGGLLAWLVVGMIPTGEWDVHIANAFMGAGIGLFIGGALGVVEGLIIKRSVLRTITGGFRGVIAGVVGGGFGLLFGGITFLLIQGGLIARMLGWMALGLFLGLGQGVLSFKFKRAFYGLIGGTLAGLVGGALYEVFTQAFLDQSADAQVYLSAAGLILIGMSLGSIIPLTIEIAREGLIVILTGRRANTEVSVIGDTLIGSSDACEVYVPGKNVDKKQAVVTKEGQGFVIRNRGDQPFSVNQSLVSAGDQVPLGREAQIQMGETRLSFKAR